MSDISGNTSGESNTAEKATDDIGEAFQRYFIERIERDKKINATIERSYKLSLVTNVIAIIAALGVIGLDVWRRQPELLVLGWIIVSVLFWVRARTQRDRAEWNRKQKAPPEAIEHMPPKVMHMLVEIMTESMLSGTETDEPRRDKDSPQVH